MTVLTVSRLSERLVLLQLQGDERLEDWRPGQFVNVRTDAPDLLLRRPISIHDIDLSTRTLSLLVQVVGRGTHHLASLQAGDSVNLIGPLGTGFKMPERGGNVLLIGGGVGAAPMLYLGRTMHEAGAGVTFLMGARTSSELVRQDVYARWGDVHLTTDDGTAGMKGLITAHDVLCKTFDAWYVCGPMPMMRAVAQMALARGVRCQVSLENRMACGIGACLCCVVRDVNGQHRCTCTEGPVFDASEIFSLTDC